MPRYKVGDTLYLPFRRREGWTLLRPEEAVPIIASLLPDWQGASDSTRSAGGSFKLSLEEAWALALKQAPDAKVSLDGRHTLRDTPAAQRYDAWPSTVALVVAAQEASTIAIYNSSGEFVVLRTRDV